MKCNGDKKNDCTHHNHLVIIFIRWVLSVGGRGVGTYWVCKSLLCYSRTLMTAKVVLREGSSLVRGALTWSYGERFLAKWFHTFLTKWSEEGWTLVIYWTEMHSLFCKGNWETIWLDRYVREIEKLCDWTFMLEKLRNCDWTFMLEREANLQLLLPSLKMSRQHRILLPITRIWPPTPLTVALVMSSLGCKVQALISWASG